MHGENLWTANHPFSFTKTLHGHSRSETGCCLPPSPAGQGGKGYSPPYPLERWCRGSMLTNIAFVSFACLVVDRWQFQYWNPILLLILVLHFVFNELELFIYALSGTVPTWLFPPPFYKEESSHQVVRSDCNTDMWMHNLSWFTFKIEIQVKSMRVSTLGQ